jgi:hypothetical protein
MRNRKINDREESASCTNFLANRKKKIGGTQNIVYVAINLKTGLPYYLNLRIWKDMNQSQ